MMGLSVLKETIKKNYIYILGFFLFLILNIILFEFNPDGVSLDDVIYLIGVPDKTVKILIIYKIFLFIFLIYYFYTYELRNIYDFILPRINFKKFYIGKILYLILLIIVVNLIHFLIVYLWFKERFMLNYDLLLTCIQYFLLLMFMELIIIDMFNSKIVVFILSCIGSYFIYVNFDFKFWVIIILIIISYCLFRFGIKRKSYNKN